MLLATRATQTITRSLQRIPSLRARPIATLPAWTSILPIETAQAFLLGAHQTTGAPWWLTLAASTFLLRASLVPVTIFSVRQSLRLGPLMQTIAGITKPPKEQNQPNTPQSLQNPQNPQNPQSNSPLSPAARVAAALHPVHRKSLLADVVKQTASRPDFYAALGGSLASIFIHLPAFATMSFAVRSLLEPSRGHNPVNELEQIYARDLEAFQSEGLMWFADLTVPDMFCTLPIINAALLLLNAHRAFGANGPLFLLRMTQVSALFPLVFATQLPSGVYWYWCLSTFYTTIQSSVMKSAAMKAILTQNIQPIPALEILSNSPTLKMIESSYQGEIEKVQAHLNEQLQLPPSERKGLQTIDAINQYLQEQYTSGHISFPLQAAIVTSTTGTESVVLALRSQLKQVMNQNVQQMYAKYQSDLQTVQSLLASYLGGGIKPTQIVCDEINSVLAKAKDERRIAHVFRAVLERNPEGGNTIQIVSDVQLRMEKKSNLQSNTNLVEEK
eukprot:TRINITY_DN1548_c0_g2_i1.p1 TRINITY_DN1548_c0_g2~~TRINITY_DN1548_c0_g2_i1.p1  ORF type:complete len:501 (+),score=128.12 TRINITY_DN1548_c0_g2_i1:104-1606(+)